MFNVKQSKQSVFAEFYIEEVLSVGKELAKISLDTHSPECISEIESVLAELAIIVINSDSCLPYVKAINEAKVLLKRLEIPPHMSINCT
jgi:hypothetical protein